MSANAAVLNMPGSLTGSVARVHPVVLFNICDSYIRRNEGQERVIGTLLGSIGENGIEVKNSYAVPHNESQGQVAVDIEFHRTMFELHHRVNPKEVIVGWYSTGDGVGSIDALIQDFYGRDCANPLHLTVDTQMVDETLSIKAYLSNTVTLGDKPLATAFHQIQVDTRMAEADRIGVQMLKERNTETLPSDIDGLQVSVKRLQGMLGEVTEYVDAVLEEKAPANKTIGRYLMDTLAAVPRLGEEQFVKLFNDSVQDVLLVMYLANMTKTQLMLADKLSTNAVAQYY
mmetsp:Transcript_42518/g.51632  ORF Transcript_42518/g.51632 Transcript_42518/m.51632 type:complete len:286 (-) Transcript_42518:298-1155(-)|eukprot:CAMPEP_0197847934 /NCGR_PEP_ID=MMETSP1438-20131217/7528_1 /TAXON_ID=1461541 /ORGANISM="Pterosperma sp., Strain CCMP1384" /LENGTH=285 /DNA_ID=CAMNT_0043460015 /DNA_START=148 /DNA_END=1005 /DNA_ORIENTATION=+